MSLWQVASGPPGAIIVKNCHPCALPLGLGDHSGQSKYCVSWPLASILHPWTGPWLYQDGQKCVFFLKTQVGCVFSFKKKKKSKKPSTTGFLGLRNGEPRLLSKVCLRSTQSLEALWVDVQHFTYHPLFS